MVAKKDIWDFLTESFPEGSRVMQLGPSWEEGSIPANVNPSDGMYVVGSHCFLVSSEDSTLEDSTLEDSTLEDSTLASNLILNWMPNRSNRDIDPNPKAASIFSMPVLENSGVLFSFDDLLGWVSYVKEQIEYQAFKHIVRVLAPQDLFPEGPSGLVRLKMAFASLTACGWKTEDLIVRILEGLQGVIDWEISADKTRYLFKVSGAGHGHVAGRVEDGALSTKLLKYSLKIPLGMKEINDTRTVTLSIGDEAEPLAKALMLRQYLKVTLNFVMRSIETNGRPDDHTKFAFSYAPTPILPVT